MTYYLKFGLFMLVLLVIWEALVRLLHVDPYTLPAPSAIVREFVTGFSDYRVHLVPTVMLVLEGIVMSVVFGIAVAVVLHLVPALEPFVYPLLIMSQNIPVIVIAPLLVIWFGFGLLPKLIVITLVCFFPITVSLLEGFKSADKDLMKYMKISGARKMQLFTKLEWPNALPYFFNGLRIAGTYSVMGAIISEWLGSDKGLGKYMILSQRAFQVDKVFVAIVWIILFALIIYGVILLLERKVVKWHR
ncbi:ABC transporter permease [Macrococcus equipercicus]|uniref:ABC transporter permease n=1 Tax=Macrococcus equipercicus TaxID=69967 RepID=A0A9Q9BWM3_9STAP|nr:ABC transporter permease [Macrococcus equipercicus]KAA1040356.1 ABC transporter permease [Macrococcus equipercicus]UTH14717.1 ABC transporter permease [Macrococcus equipercicus]